MLNAGEVLFKAFSDVSDYYERMQARKASEAERQRDREFQAGEAQKGRDFQKEQTQSAREWDLKSDELKARQLAKMFGMADADTAPLSDVGVFVREKSRDEKTKDAMTSKMADLGFNKKNLDTLIEMRTREARAMGGVDTELALDRNRRVAEDQKNRLGENVSAEAASLRGEQAKLADALDALDRKIAASSPDAVFNRLVSSEVENRVRAFQNSPEFTRIKDPAKRQQKLNEIQAKALADVSNPMFAQPLLQRASDEAKGTLQMLNMERQSLQSRQAQLSSALNNVGDKGLALGVPVYGVKPATAAPAPAAPGVASLGSWLSSGAGTSYQTPGQTQMSQMSPFLSGQTRTFEAPPATFVPPVSMDTLPRATPVPAPAPTPAPVQQPQSLLGGWWDMMTTMSPEARAYYEQVRRRPQ